MRYPYNAATMSIEVPVSEFESLLRIKGRNQWKDMKSYSGGDWVYLFVPSEAIPGDYRVVEGCFMVGLGHWWTRDQRNAPIKPTHWRHLFTPPEDFLP